MYEVHALLLERGTFCNRLLNLLVPGTGRSQWRFWLPIVAIITPPKASLIPVGTVESRLYVPAPSIPMYNLAESREDGECNDLVNSYLEMVDLLMNSYSGSDPGVYASEKIRSENS